MGNRRTYLSEHVRPRFNFGYSPTHFAGGERTGELGGLIFRGDCRDPDRLAYYGARLDTLTPTKPLRASGRVALRRGVSDSSVLLGFFHSQDSVAVSDSQLSGWPVNFLGLAIEGPSSEGFQVYPVYRFADGSSGYSRDANSPHILPNGRSADWSLEFAPDAAAGVGKLVVTYDGRRAAVDVPAAARAANNRFDRFGIVTTWIDGNSQTAYFDDITYTVRQP